MTPVVPPEFVSFIRGLTEMELVQLQHDFRRTLPDDKPFLDVVLAEMSRRIEARERETQG